jgi:phosphomannomutase/phosphoglucomutase
VDLGILPTPGVQYAVRKYYDGGVMITASHNPPKYNGIKFLDEDGIGIPDDMELAIEKLYFDEEPDRVPYYEMGEISHNDQIIDEYIDEAISKVDVEAIRDANLKVVVDCGSGAGCYTAPYLIRKLGCDVTTLNSQADGFFPGRDPEPIEENLGELITVVKELNADIGLAHDGDADRTICIDEKGNFVLGDKTFSLVEKQMLKENNGGTIVTTVATSQAIYDIAEEYNGKVIATAVGDLLVARKLKDENGLFGGEENGGLIFPDFVYGRDAVMTVAKILEIVAKEKKPISELVSELPVYYASKMKIECPDDEKEFVMDSIADEVKNTTEYKLDLTDGVKILKDDGWMIIRPSGTEPIFRCFAESDSQMKADEMTDWGISLIKKYRK